MKKKTKLFSLLGLTLLFSVGLIGCGSKKPDGEGGGGGGGEVTPPVETQIKVTAAENKTTLLIGETVQMSADVEGVEWSSTDAEVATVSSAGLVTAVKVGSTKIRAKKDGYKTGSLSITVERATNSYALVDGKTTRLELEDGSFENSNGYWGYPDWGMVPNHDGGETPIEDTDSASGGMSLGYIDSSTKITMAFTAPAAGKVEMTLCAAYASEVDLEQNFTLKINNTDVDLAGAVVPAGGSNNYYAWSEINLGEANVIEGKNTLVFECIGSGANLDYIDMKFTAGGSAQVLPKITPTEASYALEVGDTQQITADVEGLSYASSDEAVATVSNTGLITAVAAGNAVITLSKEGYKDAKVAVKVTAKVEPLDHDDYVLEDGKTTRLELEYGEFYSPSGSWGYPQWGIGPNHDGGVTPIEDQETASNGMSLGYISNGTKITMEFTAPAAGTVELTLGAAYASAVDLGVNFTLTINEVAVDLTGKEVPAASDGQSYYEWATIALGSAAVVEGKNTLVLECIGSGANLDYIDAKFDASGEVPPTPPVSDPFKAALPKVLDIARLALDDGKLYYVLKLSYTGDYEEADYILFGDGETQFEDSKIVKLEDNMFEVWFDVSSLKYGDAQFYPHLKVNDVPINGAGQNGNVQLYGFLQDGNNGDPVQIGDDIYQLVNAWGMPTIVIKSVKEPAIKSITKAEIKVEDGKAYAVVEGTSQYVEASMLGIDFQFSSGSYQTYTVTTQNSVDESGNFVIKADIAAALNKETPIGPGVHYVHLLLNGKQSDLKTFDGFADNAQTIGNFTYGFAAISSGNIMLNIVDETAPQQTITSVKVEMRNDKPVFIIAGTCKNVTEDLFKVDFQHNGQWTTINPTASVTIADGQFELVVDLSAIEGFVAGSQYIIHFMFNGAAQNGSNLTQYAGFEQSSVTSGGTTYSAVPVTTWGQNLIFLSVAVAE